MYVVAEEKSRPSVSAKPSQPSLLRQGIVAGWWTPMMDRYGPRNRVARFVVDLLPFLVLFGVIGTVYLLAR